MTNFRPGMKVVCVDDSQPTVLHPTEPLKLHAVYTVRDIRPEDDLRWPSALLVEICNPNCTYPDGLTREIGYKASRFRPVAEKPTAIDIIRWCVINPNAPIPADPREPVITPVPEYEGFEVRI